MTLQVTAPVTAETPEGPYRRLRLHAPALAARMAAGQFVTADLGGSLRRPLYPALIDQDSLDAWLPVDCPTGPAIDLLGPLGKALPMPHAPARVLFLADTQHLAALLPLIDPVLRADCPATLLLTAGDDVYPLAYLPPALEVRLAAAGHSRALLDLLAGRSDPLCWADRILVAADPSIYPALAERVRESRVGPASGLVQALLVPTIVCGVGACLGCAVSTHRGYLQACREGPFFDLLELETA